MFFMRRHRTPRMSIIIALMLLLGFSIMQNAAAAVPNPPWPARCPQRVAVILDLSSSTEPFLPAIKKSASDLVDALRGAHNEVGVVTFGTTAEVAIPFLDVGDDSQRARMKDLIDDVELPPGDGGGTNWEEALRTAAAQRPTVALLLTDGMPTVSGGASTGYMGGDDLTPAVQVADSMRQAGTRIVGVGMGLQASAVPNLEQVTGPKAGDDYYETGTDASGLLDRLYDVASKTCGIPVIALPPPEGGNFPIVPAVLGALGAALLLAVGGYLWSRKPRGKDENRPVAAPPGRTKLVDAPVRSADSVVNPHREIATPDDVPGEVPSEGPVREAPRRARRSGRLSPGRLHQISEAPLGDASSDGRGQA